MSIGRNAKTCVNHNHWSTDYKFDSTMNFTTIMLGHKKRQVRLQADVSYDPFQIFPDLQHVKDNNLFHIDEGDVFYDFIGDQGPLRFISDNFKDLLENNGVKGVSFIPIKIYGSKLQYYALLETQIDSICEHDSDGDHIYGTFQIDFTSWNGEELFYLKDSGAKVCSLRVKELIERHNISNVSFEGLDKY